MNNSMLPGSNGSRRLPADDTAKLLDVDDEVWLRWCQEWMEGLAPTVANPTPQKLVALAELGTKISFLAGRFGIGSDRIWGFCTVLRLCSRSTNEELLNRARQMLLDVAGDVVSIKGQLHWAIHSNANSDERATSTRRALTKAQRRQIVLDAASGQTAITKVAELAGERLGISESTVRSWINRDSVLKAELIEHMKRS